MSSFLGGGGGGTTNLQVGVTPISGGTSGFVLFDNAGILGEQPITQVATANIVVYVATTGSDSNPGTLAQPFATVAHAVLVVEQFDYQNLYFPRINVAAGTYPYSAASINLNRIARPTNPAQIIGAGESVTIMDDLTGKNGFLCLAGAFWVIQDIRVKTDAFAFGCVGGSAEIQIFNCGMDEETPAAGGPAAALFCNNSSVGFMLATFNVACNEFDAITQCYDGSFAIMTLGTLTLQATTAIKNKKFYIMVTDQSEVDYEPGTVVNAGGVTGPGKQLLILFGSVLITKNGVLSDVPGIGGVTGDSSTALISGSNNFAAMLRNTQSGPPTTSQISSPFYGVWKDTGVGGRFLAFNDGGAVYTTQVGNNIDLQSGASYTLRLGDQGGIVEMDNAGANTVTVPPNASVNFSVGTKIQIVQAGAGATSVVAGAGVTGRNFGTIAAQWDQATLYQRATDEWVMTL